MESNIKTPEEIQKLKEGWLHDPIWDIYETEGFEMHKKELKEFQVKVEAEWAERKNRKLLERAEKMGISKNLKLAEYILKLEMNIDFQNEKIEKLMSKINR
ncbi:hypothetical protein [Flavobacterium sp. 3-210]